MRLLAATLMVVLAALLAGCSEAPTEPEAPWHGRDLDPTTWNQWDLKPCQVIELDFHYHEAIDVTWDWVSDNRVPLQFILHTHAGDRVVDLVNVTADQHTGTFTMQAETTYSMVWTNRGPETAQLWHQHPPWTNGVLAAAPGCT